MKSSIEKKIAGKKCDTQSKLNCFFVFLCVRYFKYGFNRCAFVHRGSVLIPFIKFFSSSEFKATKQNRKK